MVKVPPRPGTRGAGAAARGRNCKKKYRHGGKGVLTPRQRREACGSAAGEGRAALRRERARPWVPCAALHHTVKRHLAASSSHGACPLFVFGLGYSGLAAARHFGARGWAVGGTVRSEAATRLQGIRQLSVLVAPRTHLIVRKL
jgi:hypothetical protein